MTLPRPGICLAGAIPAAGPMYHPDRDPPENATRQRGGGGGCEEGGGGA